MTRRHQVPGGPETRDALTYDRDPLRSCLKAVVFLAETSKPPVTKERKVRLPTAQEMWPLMCESVVRSYREATFALLTTATTTLPEFRYPTDLHVAPISPDPPLLYERWRRYLEFIEGASDDCNYLFMETDMLMLRPMALGIEDDWDVAVAYKPQGMWINSGIFLVRAGRGEAATRFVRRMLSLYEERYFGHRKFGTDQAALRDAIGLEKSPDRIGVYPSEAARVLLVPRDGYTRFARQFDAFAPPPTWILHFAQERKKWMRRFYWLHMGKGALAGRLLARVQRRARSSEL